MTYRASLDLKAKIITIIFTGLLGSMILIEIFALNQVRPVGMILITFLLAGVYVFAFVLRPTGYTVTEKVLTIHRLFKDVEIDREGIAKTELLTKEQTSWSFRIFGNGGLFGYFGKFSNSKLGNMTWYATRKDSMVLILSKNNKKIIITPDHAQDFVADLNK